MTAESLTSAGRLTRSEAALNAVCEAADRIRAARLTRQIADSIYRTGKPRHEVRFEVLSAAADALEASLAVSMDRAIAAWQGAQSG